MGKVTYRPGKHSNKENGQAENQRVLEMETNEKKEEQTVQIRSDENQLTNEQKKQHGFDNLKVIGDINCEYQIYVEDYAFTYLYQYANIDLSRESSAFLIGEIYEDTKEAVIRGIIPVCEEELVGENEWIDQSVLDKADEERQKYFSGQDIIGWLHMQPGYGIMMTMKELREHQSVFERMGTLCMLVDAINKIESIYVYEDDELKEQTGYCMYYERNEQMQQYMLEHSFKSDEKKEIKDQVVNQFREIGKIRKQEYLQRKQVNMTVVAASVILIIFTALVVKFGGTHLNNNLPVSKPIVDHENKNNAVGEDHVDIVVKPAKETKLETQVDSEGEGLEGKAQEEQTEKLELPQEEVAEGKIQEEDEKAQKYDIYVVKEGDTLADISYKAYGEAKKSVEIAKLNGLKSTDCIYVGQKLKMPIYN